MQGSACARTRTRITGSRLHSTRSSAARFRVARGRRRTECVDAALHPQQRRDAAGRRRDPGAGGASHRVGVPRRSAGAKRGGRGSRAAASADAVTPKGARSWLTRRPVTSHVNLASDWSGHRAAGAPAEPHRRRLVLAGGGARGFAHLGIWRALRERGIEVDVLGGTSIGAIMAALIAVDQPLTRRSMSRAGLRQQPDR